MFKYTEAQWLSIQKTIQHLPNVAVALKFGLRTELERYADFYLCEMATLGRKKKFDTERRLWAAAEKSFAKAASNIRAAMDAESDQQSRSGRQLDVEIALYRLQSFVGARANGPPAPPNSASIHRRTLHVQILEVWRVLGGQLKLSRNPKVAGPLARYFAAVTQPLHGGSLETLPDIVKRQRRLLAAGSGVRSYQDCILAKHDRMVERGYDYWRFSRAMKHRPEGNGVNP